MTDSKIFIEDYDYTLPEEKIAFFPKEKRDESQLLIYKNGQIQADIFKNIADYLPENAVLIFNNTKVVQARIVAFKASGARIEIFCLEPLYPHTDRALAFQQTGSCVWKCLVGNAKKWKEKLQLNLKHDDTEIKLTIENQENLADGYAVKFSWEPASLPFLEILDKLGKIPLPPYIRREAEETDTERYQTVYAEIDGSVAAPTAGLHFTEAVFERLKARNIPCGHITLHVGAGTFKPVQTPTLQEHLMHKEQIVLTPAWIENMLSYQNKHIIAVGTTTVRTLESVYGFGMKLLLKKKDPFFLHQWEIYDLIQEIKVSKEEALEAVLNEMKQTRCQRVLAHTELMITGAYQTCMARSLITNFHQPKSTLLVLLSSFVQNEWKTMYDYALSHDFRFLSYGDSCLILR